MARPGIARELAQEQTIQPSIRQDSNNALPLTPTTLARPMMLKSWIEKEEKRKAKGDGTGVRLTTIVQQEGRESFGDDDDDDDKKMVCGLILVTAGAENLF